MFNQENESIILHRVRTKGLTVEDILKQELNISGRLFRKIYKSKGIKFNGKDIKRNSIINNQGIITIIMGDEKEHNEPENMKLDIVYEDYDIMIINKSPGIVVHPTKSHSKGTLANGLAYYFKEKGIHKKIRFVNRLDMDTSGILVVAKNPYGHQQLSSQFEGNLTEKKYLVLVEGRVRDDYNTIDKPIGKDKDNPIKNIVCDDGKPSVTRYKVIEKYKLGSLLEVEILTGRTHQIRVHMDYIGHRVIGDTLYNEENEFIKRQALHSYSLKFNTTRTNESVLVKASMPDDMKYLISKLK